jgi:hypothetical protein
MTRRVAKMASSAICLLPKGDLAPSRLGETRVDLRVQAASLDPQAM